MLLKVGEGNVPVCTDSKELSEHIQRTLLNTKEQDHLPMAAHISGLKLSSKRHFGPVNLRSIVHQRVPSECARAGELPVTAREVTGAKLQLVPRSVRSDMTRLMLQAVERTFTLRTFVGPGQLWFVLFCRDRSHIVQHVLRNRLLAIIVGRPTWTSCGWRWSRCFVWNAMGRQDLERIPLVVARLVT